MHILDDLKKLAGFDEEDVERVAKLAPVVEPRAHALVDRVLRGVEDYQIAIATPTEKVSSKLPLDDEFTAWFQCIFEGDLDREFVQRCRQLGQSCVQMNVEPHVVIGLVNRTRTLLLEAISEESTSGLATESLVSLGKSLDISLALILRSFYDTVLDQKTNSSASLAQGLAHEIRNPVNTVTLHLSLLERKLRGNLEDYDEFSPILESINTAVTCIENLTREIVDLVNPDEPAPAWYDAEAFLGELENSYGPTLRASNIILDTKLDGETEIWADLDSFKQVMLNLVRNAAEAIDTSGTITISVVNRENRTVIEVTDDGRGMNPADQYRVFDLFYTTKPTGTGIGLSVVKQQVEAHGGTIDVSSLPDRGTTFSIYLPRPSRVEDPVPS